MTNEELNRDFDAIEKKLRRRRTLRIATLITGLLLSAFGGWAIWTHNPVKGGDFVIVATSADCTRSMRVVVYGPFLTAEEAEAWSLEYLGRETVSHRRTVREVRSVK